LPCWYFFCRCGNSLYRMCDRKILECRRHERRMFRLSEGILRGHHRLEDLLWLRCRNFC